MDLFGTAGIRGNVVERVTPELALAVGRAAGRPGEEFVVARDGRETGTALAAAMEAGLESAGADVRRIGKLPTPGLAFASQGRRGVMLTASHNPPTDNGIKLFEDGVEYDRTAEREVESLVAEDSPPLPWDEWGTGTSEDVLEDYRNAVIEYARGHGAPLDGIRIAVDCGNGMGGLATPQVLRALGARVVTLNANVDGHFPGRPSKPTPDTLTDLLSFVATDDFAFGLAHDGDADRIVLVNGDGEVVHEDTVVAILAEQYVQESEAQDPVVVTTPNASARIDERVREAGGRVERVRLGALHEGITSALEASDDDTEVVFAAEPWKHIHTQFGGWIDGVVSAAVLARLVADVGSVETLRGAVTERPYRKVSVDCPDDAKAGAMERLETAIPERLSDATVRTEYGVRAELPDGSWILVRPSGTEPYIRIYAESEDVATLVADTENVVAEAVSDSRN
ncbi:phosphopentomutase/phosphoglucosamine mutase [Haladaptatus sp. NG-SE-30]